MKKVPQFKDKKFGNVDAFQSWLLDNTKVKIIFKFKGQDMMIMHLHKSGEIIHCDYDADLFCGRFVNLDMLAGGQALYIWGEAVGMWTRWHNLIISQVIHYI